MSVTTSEEFGTTNIILKDDKGNTYNYIVDSSKDSLSVYEK